MKLTPKQKKVAIYVGIGAITIAYFLYARKKNKEEASAILDYINKLPSQVDPSAATDMYIDQIKNIKLDMNNLAINGKRGSYKDPKIMNEMVKATASFNKSIDGAGTNLTLFFDTLKKVQSKNTFSAIDKVYEKIYKESLTKAMQGETLLNSPAYGFLSDKGLSGWEAAMPYLAKGRWHPNFAKYFESIKDY